MFANTLDSQLFRQYNKLISVYADDADETSRLEHCVVLANDLECRTLALYSYNQKVAEWNPTEGITLYTDCDNYEWSRTTMRHIVAWVRHLMPYENVRGIRDVRRLAYECIPAKNGERVRYDDKKKTWTVVHA